MSFAGGGKRKDRVGDGAGGGQHSADQQEFRHGHHGRDAGGEKWHEECADTIEDAQHVHHGCSFVIVELRDENVGRIVDAAATQTKNAGGDRGGEHGLHKAELN